MKFSSCCTETVREESKGSIRIKIYRFLSIILFSLISWYCELNKEKDILDPLTVYITTNDYKTVSNIKAELLACGPVAVANDDGTMTVAYLADEESPIESETSSSIFIRVARFNVNSNIEEILFTDIAKANTILYGHNTGSAAPYEPNILQTDEGVFVMYREGGLSGKYMSCKVDSNELICDHYDDMTLDGVLMDPAHLRSVYEHAGNCILETSPVLVFTTQIVHFDNCFYTHIGGYEYNGIIVKSENGRDWESITIPSTVDGLNYILEGAVGRDVVTGNFFLCARGNKVVLYRYDSSFSEKAEPIVLQGVTTSRPTFFNYQEQLFLIVNMDNDFAFSTGRRNTANIYRVDGETGNLTRVKTLKCKEGCSYHSVQIVNNDIWMIFQTDARQIAPETQGRSNLALYKIDGYDLL